MDGPLTWVRGFDMIDKTRTTNRKEGYRGMPEDQSEFHEMCNEIMGLMINVGLMSAVMQNFPEEVQANWADRIIGYKQWAIDQIEEIQAFGEYFDDNEAN